MSLDLTSYMKAGYPVIYLVTPEEARAELVVYAAAQAQKRKLKVWSHTEGIFTHDYKEHDEEKQDPHEALEHIKASSEDGIVYIFRDLHKFFDSPRVLRLIRDISRDFKQFKKTLVIMSPSYKLPPDIERDVTLLDFELPTQEELNTVWGQIYDGNKTAIGTISEEQREQIIQAAMGLTCFEAENAFAKAVVLSKTTKSPIAKLVSVEKANAIKKSGILEWYEIQTSAQDIGGLDNLKQFFLERGKAYTKKAREFGLPKPRGIVLVGLPGCGKCVKEDSLIISNGVLLRIGNISSHRNTKKYADIDITVQSDCGTQKATQFHWVGLSKTKKMTLSNGMLLEGRLEHPVMVLNKDGLCEWKKLQNIKRGDIVMTRIGADNLIKNSEYKLQPITAAPAYNDSNGDHRSCGETPVILPPIMTEDFAWWLGTLTGDGGWSSPTAINFCQHERNKVVFDQFVKLMNTLFGVRPSINRPTDKSYMIVAQSGRRHLRRFLSSLGLVPYTEGGKSIPEAIFNGGTDIWESYIAGLWDTDGHIGNHNELTLKEKWIIQDLQTILWTLGIPSDVSPKKVKKYPDRTYWRLNIVGGQLAHGFSKIVAKMRNRRKAAKYNNREVDPNATNASRFGNYTHVKKLVTQLWNNATKSGVKRDQFVLHTKTNRQFSRRTFIKLHKYISDFNVELDNYLQWIYAETIPLPVIDIVDSEANVCDIGVPANNTFVTNGILSHNSLSAKAAANILGVSLIRFDIGRVFSGIVGSSEQNMRTAINLIESAGNCVVWVDEMDKAFSGMGGGGQGDNGVADRVFGSFLTWMQEKKGPAFVIATMNKIEGILERTPELLRKGRFDEIFFVGLPTMKERELILDIHIKRFGRDSKKLKIDLPFLASKAEGFSGAELEEAVIAAMYKAFHKETDLTTDYIMGAILNTNPLSRSAETQLAAMKRWAESNAVPASIPDKAEKRSINYKRSLDLDEVK